MSFKLGLVGFFGWGNYGDELMRSVWENQLPVNAQVVHDRLDKPYFSRPSVEMAAEYDAFVIGGGDLIMPRAVSTLYWNRSWLGKPCLVSGVGVALEDTFTRPDVPKRIGRFLSDQNVLRISARDTESANWIRSCTSHATIQVCPDLGFGMPLEQSWLSQSGDSVSGSSAVVAIVIRKHLGDDISAAVDRVLRWAQQRGSRVEFLIAATGLEANLELEVIRDRWPGVPVRAEHTIQAVTAAFGDYAVVASAKFHVSLMCMRLGIPNLTLRATHKIQQLSHQLQDPGTRNVVNSDHSSADIESLAMRPVPADKIHELEIGAQSEIASVRRCLEDVAAN
ncbi:polysaccharide pyruvyl transferase family protein [Kocuria sp.]|uniref:polysaccharide pyruvyl transferase family protein n=1 Tax=Kocuria sp. TaxID=1871328 RepID=UPI0026DEE126|nr:polysaccharide pyruvyl transferase family protein [Kocuria sp.]MDO5617809.1 polysaccharide pyruvyl transferase family protein [Kocuria sp.]